MRIDHIIAAVPCSADGFSRFSLAAVISVKIFQSLFHFFGDRIFSAFAQRSHKLRTRLGILSGKTVDQTFQVTGDQNIHGRGSGQYKLTFSVIGSCPEEIIENLVFIGSTDQFMNRQPHLLCIISSKDISKVSGRNCNIDFFTGIDLSCFYQFCIRINIVYDLRHKTADINGIGRGKLKTVSVKLCCQLLIIKHPLNRALSIVKISCDSHH